MSEITGPKFNCPGCGKEYKWKPELAGKKGKCKCGSVFVVPAKAVKPVPAPAPVPAPVPVPAPQPELEEDTYDVAAGDVAAGTSAQEDAMVAPPPPPPLPASSPRRAPISAATAQSESSAGARQLHWAPASKWLAIGVLVGALAIWELSSPTDPDSTTVRKWKLLIVLANRIHPLGGFFLLGAFALFMLVVGVLILLGKAKDSDYEHEQQQDKWPSSRGRR